jgi:hypothetical protein
LRKLPIISPKRVANMPISVEGATIRFCHIAPRPRPRPRAVVPQPLTLNPIYLSF